ncbi:MAG: hypothetical protein R3185_01595, partial [Candidatus Thermoplasmatota archaeon]|nr:hypothetical protein [Candidatus Thermoplasmatota archaeon]
FVAAQDLGVREDVEHVREAVRGEITQNDGGSGDDAGDSKDRATRLDHPGEYRGKIRSGTDADWYALPTDSRDVCVETQAWANEQTRVDLSLPGTDVSTLLGPGSRASLALVGQQIDEIRLGLSTPETTKLDDHDYGFSLDYRTAAELLANGDAGSGQDAGDTLATAAPLEDACLGGSIGAEDTTDVYRFEGTAGSTTLVSLAQVSGEDPVTLSVISPTGERVASLQDGDVRNVELTETGTWYLELTTTTRPQLDQWSGLNTGNGASDSMDDYLVSFEGPDPEPCDPTCI